MYFFSLAVIDSLMAVLLFLFADNLEMKWKGSVDSTEKEVFMITARIPNGWDYLSEHGVDSIKFGSGEILGYLHS